MLPMPPVPSAKWSRSAHRAELLALYAEVDALLEGWSCACSRTSVGSEQAQCCHFAVTGREPYPTAVEFFEIEHAMQAAGARPRDARKTLPLAEELRPCPVLAGDGRCRIYRSRPFGCRTFFCDHAEGPRAKLPRSAVQAIGRKIADLSARFAPRDPLPRPLTRALASKR